MVFTSLWLRQKIQANQRQFWWPWRCSGMTRGTSPNKAHPGLHSKPLDAAIGWVPAPYCPDSGHGQRIRINTQNTNKTQLLASNYDYGTFRALVVCENFNPKTNPLLSSSMQRASCKYEMPRLELKSSRTFLAIKRCQRTKIWKKWCHIWHHRG
jgi:hypothetical protein